LRTSIEFLDDITVVVKH